MPRFAAAKATSTLDKKFSDNYNYLIDLLDTGYMTETVVNGHKIEISLDPRRGLIGMNDGVQMFGLDPVTGLLEIGAYDTAISTLDGAVVKKDTNYAGVKIGATIGFENTATIGGKTVKVKLNATEGLKFYDGTTYRGGLEIVDGQLTLATDIIKAVGDTGDFIKLRYDLNTYETVTEFWGAVSGGESNVVGTFLQIDGYLDSFENVVDAVIKTNPLNSSRAALNIPSNLYIGVGASKVPAANSCYAKFHGLEDGNAGITLMSYGSTIGNYAYMTLNNLGLYVTTNAGTILESTAAGLQINGNYVIPSNVIYSFGNGILIDLFSSTLTTKMITVTIRGNSYSGVDAVDTIAQVYHYTPTGNFLSPYQLNNGFLVGQVKFFLDGGRVKCWFPEPSYASTLIIDCYTQDAKFSPASITNATEPTGTSKVTCARVNSWHSNNDGTGSGLDADLLDGFHATAFAPKKNWVMNGGFDVWQRAESLVLTTETILNWVSDRWFDYVTAGGGTAPTLTRSMIKVPQDGFAKASRIAFNGAGASLGAGSGHFFSQSIEFGTSKLCGLGKKISLSFWARSDVANKRLGLYAVQGYGSSGSPSANEYMTGHNITLTSAWTKYTFTFDTYTLSGKTFGTDINDRISIEFMPMWGSNFQSRVGASTAETYVGAGYIDIANVCLVQGDIAVDYEPESYDDVLTQCQRYCYVINSAEGVWTHFGIGLAISAVQAKFLIPVPVTMRKVPTVEGYSSMIVADEVLGQWAVTSLVTGNNTTRFNATVVANVASGLTTYRPLILAANNTLTAYLILTAEL